MERSEPTLVPQWLRSTGNVSGGGSSGHHSTSSSSASDVSSSTHNTENRSLKNVGDLDSPRLAFLDRTSSSNSRRNSSNGSAKNAYSSFSRSHRDRDRERDKARLNFGDQWDRDSLDPIGSVLGGARGQKDLLRRSHSMVSRKQGEFPSQRVPLDAKNGCSSNHVNGNALISASSIGSIGQKAVFEKDFPSLGGEDKHRVPDIGRVASPGLSSAVQSLPVGTSALIGGEGWTSALAEVPPSTCIGSTAQTVIAPIAGPASAVAGLNMAEALTQAPAKPRTPPLLSEQTQRLEELVIKQSRQLIPVTPSMPKSSIINLSDKTKPKAVVRPGEATIAAKSMQQTSLHPGGQSLVGGHLKSDGLKTSQGKLYVLKPGRENGTLTSPKDVASPTVIATRSPSPQLSVTTSVQAAPPRSPNNAKLSSGDRKPASLKLTPGFSLEKRPSLSQTKSRNDFFNLLKKKTVTNNSGDSVPVVSAPNSEISCPVNEEEVSYSNTVQNGANLTTNGETFEDTEISEEEAAFLRSLGWEENTGEDEGLTDDEIKSFFLQLLETKPSLKVCKGMPQKLLESYATILGIASPEVSPSEFGSEA